MIAGALESIAVEMGHKLARMSYSSIIRESEDFGCVICDEQARQLAESSQSTPLQSGPIPGYIRGIARRFAELGEEWKPGDVVIHNHAYFGASHEPDVGFVVPIFHRGELVALLGDRRPPPRPRGADARLLRDRRRDRRLRGGPAVQRDQDRGGGPPERVDLADHPRQRPRRAARRRRHGGAGGRLPDRRRALPGARRPFRHRDREGGERGPDGLLGAAAPPRDRAASRTERYEAEGFIDGFQNDPDPANRDLRVKATVTVEGSDIHVDLTGTSPQIDLPLNMPFEGTVDIAIYLTIRSILLDSDRHGSIPANSGLFRPISITAPEGCLANPRFPAPTIARFCPGNIVADTVMRALAPLVPDNVSAGVGNLKVVAYSGLAAGGQHWVYMDIQEGSYGGRPGKDGLDAVDTLYANTRNNPIEDIESHYPLRVTRYELNVDTGGAGRWRGGLGTVREIEFLAPGRDVARG